LQNALDVKEGKLELLLQFVFFALFALLSAKSRSRNLPHFATPPS
jgi:hypothetical protein